MKAFYGSNNVNIYNLNAGKSLPDWLTDRKRRKLSKKDGDFRRKVQLIQDFEMPDVSSCIKVSPDGQYILAAGTYKPRLKCFETSALSLKFERCFDAEIINFEILSEDYSKIIFLEEERYLEFHNQGGRWFRLRIPKFGRDLAYHYPSCDLYIASSGSEIYRLNLSQGRFLNSIQTSALSNNKCLFNPAHYLLCCGTDDGRVEAWDPRSRQKVGTLDCAIHDNTDDLYFSSYSSASQLGISSLCFNDALTLAVGTKTGKVMVFDIRSNKPLIVKDHGDGFPIKSLAFHHRSDMLFSMSCSSLKIWEKNTGKPYTSLETDVILNDFAVVEDSGMIFLATESPKMHTYFIPSLGPAPKWCGHLDALIEELAEEEVLPTYDDYEFVTFEELQKLGLDSLIGTSVLKAVMHGYYIHTKLYNKAKSMSNQFDYDQFVKRKVKQKIAEQNKRSFAPKNLPTVNKELYCQLAEEESGKEGAFKSFVEDERFGSLFSNPDYTIDKESEGYRLAQFPLLSKLNKRKLKQKKDELYNEDEFLELQKLMNPVKPKKDRPRPQLAESSEDTSNLSTFTSGNTLIGLKEEHKHRTSSSSKYIPLSNFIKDID